MMFRCLKPGCPKACGTRHRPNCTEQWLYYATFVLLSLLLLASFACGVERLARTGGV